MHSHSHNSLVDINFVDGRLTISNVVESPSSNLQPSVSPIKPPQPVLSDNTVASRPPSEFLNESFQHDAQMEVEIFKGPAHYGAAPSPSHPTSAVMTPIRSNSPTMIHPASSTSTPPVFNLLSLESAPLDRYVDAIKCELLKSFETESDTQRALNTSLEIESTKVSTLAAKVTILERDHATVESEKRDLLKQIGSFKQAIQRLESECAGGRERVAELERVNEELEGNLMMTDLDNTNLKTLLSEATEKCKECNASFAELYEKQQDISRDKEAMMEEIRLVNVKVFDLWKTFQDAKCLNTKLADRIESDAALISELRRSQCVLSEENERMATTIKTLEARNFMLEDTNQQLVIETEAMNLSLAKSHEEHHSMQDSLQTLSDMFAALQPVPDKSVPPPLSSEEEHKSTSYQ
jgi:DNA repair exonuclease SbcCD ATPase subunit